MAGSATTPRKAARSPGRPRDASRESAILEETLALLGEAGFAGLTVDAVVARAKVSKATIYRRWSSKEELAMAAFELLPPIELADTGNLEDDVAAYIEQYSRYLKTTHLSSVLPALVSEAMHNAVLAEKLRETVRERRRTGIEMVERAVARGELPKGVDAELVQEMIISTMVHRSFFEPDRLDSPDFRTITRIIIAGLNANYGQGAPSA